MTEREGEGERNTRGGNWFGWWWWWEVRCVQRYGQSSFAAISAVVSATSIVRLSKSRQYYYRVSGGNKKYDFQTKNHIGGRDSRDRIAIITTWNVTTKIITINDTLAI